MNAKILLTAAMASVCLAGASVHGGVLASDNADNLQYAPQPNHNWSVINGGFGYNPWTPLADRSGGGTYMEGVGVNNRQVDGNSSFALSAGGGAYDISRPLVTPLAGNTWYQFDILLRFDTAYFPGASLVNLRAGNNMAGFAAGELFSFGIVNGAELSYTDGSGFHPLGFDARGPVFDLDVIFMYSRN